MTPFLLLAFLMVAAATAWLTHPLWRPALAARAASGGFDMPGRGALWLSAALALFRAGRRRRRVCMARRGRLLGGRPRGAAGEQNSAQVAAPARASSADSLAQAEARISDMVDRLAERLKTRPDDSDGWQMLGRSYAALGKHAQAIGAYETAMRLRPDDPTLLAELAFSAAATNRRVAGSDSTQLLQRALKLDPRNPKALALAGTLSLDRKDYQGAVQYWSSSRSSNRPTARSAAGSAQHRAGAPARRLAVGVAAGGRPCARVLACRDAGGCRARNGERHRQRHADLGTGVAGARRTRRHGVHFCAGAERVAHAAGRAAQAGQGSAACASRSTTASRCRRTQSCQARRTSSSGRASRRAATRSRRMATCKASSRPLRSGRPT